MPEFPNNEQPVIKRDGSMLWVSRWVWIMSFLNLLIILMLAYVIIEILPSSIEREKLFSERDRLILERDQLIEERDQAFKERNEVLDQRFTQITDQFDRATTSLIAIDAKLQVLHEDQKRFRVLLGAQTDAFNVTSNKLEELVNELKK